MRRVRTYLAASLLVLPAPLLAAPASSQMLPSSPAMLAHACAGCHGTLGVSVGPNMPRLAGQTRQHILDAMREFRSGARPSTIMGRLARGYDDAELSALADFYGVK